MTCISDVDLISKAEIGAELNREEIVRLLSLRDPSSMDALFDAADNVRKAHVGDEIFLRGIIEFSNHCINNCLYCGLRRDNKSCERYRMDENQILDLSNAIKSGGCSTVVLQSGEDPYYNTERVCSIISRIKTETGLAITLSIGQRTYKDYEAFIKAGADRYLLRHETASESLFSKLCPGRKLEERTQCLIWLKSLGYEAGSGCMVGLPGQSIEDLADDVLLIKTLDIDMIGIGPFIPHEQTPLADCSAGDPLLVLKLLAVIRLVTRDTNIPSTTALGVLDVESRRRAFRAGANIFMPVFTPQDYASRYDLYPGKGDVKKADGAILDFKGFFSSIGRPIGVGPGGRRRGGQRKV